MNILQLNRAQCTQFAVQFSPGAPGGIGSEGLAIVFGFCIQVLVKRQGGTHHTRRIGIVGAQNYGRLLCFSKCSQALFDTGDDGFCEPVNVVLANPFHGFSQCHHQSYVGIFFNKGSNGLLGIISNQRNNRTVAILCFDAMVIRKRF